MQRIPIWLGTYGKRALAVTGRLADGWIRSLAFASPDQATAMREEVRAAAGAAGRNPEEITYAYNVGFRIDGRGDSSPAMVSGPPERVADRLLGFTKMGFTALNLIAQGPAEQDQVEQLAVEVLPGVRARS